MAGEIKHEWEGSILTITSDAGTSAADLKGPKGDVGPRGPQGPAGVIYDADGQIAIDLSPYATLETVDAAIANIPFEDYATHAYVSTEIAKAQLVEVAGDVDLSGFATKDDLAGLDVDIEIDHQTIVTDSYGQLRTAIGGFANQGGGVDYQLKNIEVEAPNNNNDYTRGFGTIGKAWYPGCLYNITMTFKDGDTIAFDAMFEETYQKTSSGILEYTGIHMMDEYRELLEATQDHISEFTPFNAKDGKKRDGTYYIDGELGFEPYITEDDYEPGYAWKPQYFKYIDYCPNKWIVTAVTVKAEGYVPMDGHYIPVDGRTIYLNDQGKLACAVSLSADGSISLDNYYTKDEIDALIASGGGNYPSSEEVDY